MRYTKSAVTSGYTTCTYTNTAAGSHRSHAGSHRSRCRLASLRSLLQARIARTCWARLLVPQARNAAAGSQRSHASSLRSRRRLETQTRFARAAGSRRSRWLATLAASSLHWLHWLAALARFARNAHMLDRDAGSQRWIATLALARDACSRLAHRLHLARNAGSLCSRDAGSLCSRLRLASLARRLTSHASHARFARSLRRLRTLAAARSVCHALELGSVQPTAVSCDIAPSQPPKTL